MENWTDTRLARKHFRPNDWIRSLEHLRRGFRLGVATFLAALPPMAWVWWISASLLPAFFILALGVLSWNIYRGVISSPPDRGRIPLRVFLDLALAVLGLWLYGEIAQRMETGNVSGAMLTLGITVPVLLLSALALRSCVLGRVRR